MADPVFAALYGKYQAKKVPDLKVILKNNRTVMTGGKVRCPSTMDMEPQHVNEKAVRRWRHVVESPPLQCALTRSCAQSIKKARGFHV
jgi:hypothetical protein